MGPADLGMFMWVEVGVGLGPWAGILALRGWGPGDPWGRGWVWAG